ncbi:zinc transporter ZTP29 isoform X2 [Physcomitrium patens]|uniref:ZIP family transporter n=1 Tax=Physcomitrium patens TaxID=3218 RepID=A0A7I4B359_PHYPA|nr:zinc transporter ZTP29-like isoform X2 [Physcomitrium patens]|eukprot:XP_024399667.1 zinc transporter ZTP29-like isoform X2 [Physcomitrella patens]
MGVSNDEIISSGSQVWVALLLTMVGGLSTALGGLVVVLQPTPNLKRLGILQGLAAGLMFSISFNDLMHNAINAIGFPRAHLWFFGGVLMFAGVVTLIPEPSLTPQQNAAMDAAGKGKGIKQGKDVEKPHLMRQRRKQVLMSGIVTAVGIGLHNFPEGIAVFLGSIKGLRSMPHHILEGLLAGVGGIMAFLTLHEMVPLALEYAGRRQAIASVFIGMALMSVSLYLLEISVPQDLKL